MALVKHSGKGRDQQVARHGDHHPWNYDPFPYSPFAAFDRMFDEAFGMLQRLSPLNNMNVVPMMYPSMNVHEDKKRNLVTATFELPGVDKNQVAIDVHHNVLTVSGEQRFESDRDGPDGAYVVRERRFGRFSRSIQLPEGIQDEDIRASMHNGVLTITYPRYSGKPEHRPRRIAIM